MDDLFDYRPCSPSLGTWILMMERLVLLAERAVKGQGVPPVEDQKPTAKMESTIQASIDVTALQGLLPANQKFQFNEKARIVNLLRIEPPEILAQLQFTRNEWCVLTALIISHPYYTPYEELLACLTSLSLADCRTRILVAQEAGSQELNRELKPVRQAISGIRKKLRSAIPFLQISFTPGLGYGLTTNRHYKS